MSLSFDDPVWLLAALGAVPLALVGLAWFVSMSVVRRWSAVIIRAALFLLIAAMLAGASSVRNADKIAVIGLIDVSGSVRRFADAGVSSEGKPIDPLQAARSFFARAGESRGPDDLLGLVVFDGKSIAIAAPTRADIADRAVDTTMAEGTNIEQAILSAAALLPPDASGRLVLVSDGAETAGDAMAAVKELASRGRSAVPIDVIPLRYSVANEVVVESVDAPPRAAAEATVTVRVVLMATDGAAGTLNLLREGEPVDANGDDPGVGRRITLRPGRNVELINLQLPPGRIHRFEAVFEPERVADGRAERTRGDTRLENNRGEAFSITPGRGAVLLVDGVGGGNPSGAGATLAEALRASGIDVTLVGPDGVPPDLLSLEAFDLVILQNVPADAVTQATQETIVSYVRDLGGGLVMVGGPDSFGAGGWKGSTLEPILPVRLDLPEKLIQPDAAIVFILDNSGSMGRGVMNSLLSQQQVANEAAALAVKSLDKRDLVGVIVFNSETSVLVPLAKHDDPKATAEKILSISSGGGTVLGPAMEKARELLGASKAALKHVIILSDGQSMQSETLPGLAARMRLEGINVSTIAVGSAADDKTMRQIALDGGGAYYPVTNPSLLPRFFLKAVKIIRSPMIREVEFQPVVHPSGSPLVSGLSQPPPLGGLVLTQRRPEATITYAMSAPTGEPLLAHWSVDLGHVAAFTSDAHHWARAWLDWPGYQKLWTQLARVIARPAGDTGLETTTEVVGDTLRLRLDAAAQDGTPIDMLSVPATVYGPDGKRTDLTLSQTGPGLYEGQAPARLSGNYITVLKPRQGAKALTPVVGGASIASGVEYRRLTSDVGLLQRIAEATGGRRLDLGSPDAASLFDRADLPPTYARSPLWRSLLVWTIIVLLLDVATRRIAWDRFLSRQYGAELRAAAIEAVKDRGAQASKAVTRLRGTRGAERPATEGTLTEGDARRVTEAVVEQRRLARAAAIKAARASGTAPPERHAPPPQAQPRPPEPPKPAPKPADPGPGDLKAAKRRAQERFGGASPEDKH